MCKYVCDEFTITEHDRKILEDKDLELDLDE